MHLHLCLLSTYLFFFFLEISACNRSLFLKKDEKIYIFFEVYIYICSLKFIIYFYNILVE